MFSLHAHQDDSPYSKRNQFVKGFRLLLHVPIGTLQNHMKILFPAFPLNAAHHIASISCAKAVQDNTYQSSPAAVFLFRYSARRFLSRPFSFRHTIVQHVRTLSRFPGNEILIGQHLQSLFAGDTTHIILLCQLHLRREPAPGRKSFFLNTL